MPTQDQNSQFHFGYTIKETADILRCAKQTVYNAINDGLLESFMRGRNRFITEDALRAYQHKLIEQSRRVQV